VIERISPPIHVHTPLGPAEAHWLRMDTSEVPYEFLCVQSETKEFWSWPNHYIRMAGSVSGARDDHHSKIFLSPKMEETLRPHINRHKQSPLYDGSPG